MCYILQNPSIEYIDKEKYTMAAKKQTNINKQSVVSNYVHKICKIEKLPKNVRETIPFTGIMNNGIIETYPGTFTKAYKLEDVNFSIAPLEDQAAIYQNFCDLLNSFDSSIKWQICMFNHEIDKKRTVEDIRIRPQKDGLNMLRKEMNGILLENLKSGNNSYIQDKYLAVSIEDTNAERAAVRLKSLDNIIDQKIKKISGEDTKPLTTIERISILYNIYNQDSDYRFNTGIYDNKDFNLAWIDKQGLSVKDLIGPASFDFSKGSSFKVGDMYAKGMYLVRIPQRLSTDFLNNLSLIQSNMLISISYEAEVREKAISLVRHRMSDVDAQIAGMQKRNMNDGFFSQLPPEMENKQKNARDLMNDVSSRNQNIFYLTFTVVIFARTQEQLDEATKQVKTLGNEYSCPIKTRDFDQEFVLSTALPLCRNDIMYDIMFTTETAGVFIPYNTKEIMQKNSIFYGLNKSSKNMIMYNRITGDNYNGLIFGSTGSGKSFSAKCEMTQVLLNQPNTQVFLIDPQGEYAPLAKELNGEIIHLAPGSNAYINPLDLDISDGDGEVDPIIMKSDYVISLFEIIYGKNRELSPKSKSLLDKAVRKIYRAYIDDLSRSGKTCDVNKCPTLSDLRRELIDMKNDAYEAGQLADILQYAIGSLDTFAHRTNVNTNSRFVIYDITKLGSGLKELGLYICLNDILNKTIENSKRNLYTWFYIDEFHILLENEGTTLFVKRLWKTVRKWNGVPTGITQNTADLLRNDDTITIFNNTSFVIMLKSALQDRQNLSQLLNLSDAQLEYITNSNKGHGLLYNGKITLPFGYDFPKNTKLYAAMTTAHDAANSFA